jgi:hypothetical protein
MTQQMQIIVFSFRRCSLHFCNVLKQLRLSLIHQLMYRFLLLLSLLFSAGSVAGQGWERVYDGGGGGQINDIALTEDGGFVMVGYYNNAGRARMFKTDADGFLQWTKDFILGNQTAGEAVIVTKDGGYAVAGYSVVSTPNSVLKQPFLLKTNKSGTVLWTKTFPSTYDAAALDLVELADGSLALCGFQKISDGQNLTENVSVLKTAADGTLLWSKTFGDPSVSELGNSLTLSNNGDLVIAGEKGASNRNIYVLRISSDSGNLIWQNEFGFFNIGSGTPADDIARDIVATDDGNFVLAGRSNLKQGSNGILLKIVGSGSNTILWLEDYQVGEFYGMTKAKDGGFYATGNRTVSDAQEDLYIVRTDAQGNKICEVTVGRAGLDFGACVVATPDGGAAAAGMGDIFFGTLQESNPYLVKTDKNCLVFTSYLAGHIFHDLNKNCELDSSEPGLEDWIVKIESPNFTRYAVADVDGSFQLLVDTGTYTIQLFPPNNYWEPCEPVVTLPVTAFSDTFSFNIPVRTGSECPRNEVDVATPLLRRCAENTYTVRYCNSGTITSINTNIEVSLDPYLTYISSSIPFAQQNGNTFSFDVGTLVNGDCGSFTINAFLDCDNTVTGQAHCVNAHIYPDSFCNVSSAWDGSIISARATCINDTVAFNLKNIGINDMGTAVGFVITEDVIMLTDPNDPMFTVQLLANQDSMVWTGIATGKTYRIIAQQSPGYPSQSYPTAAVEGCKSDTSGTFTTGFYTMFPQDDAEPFKSSDCQESNETDFNPPYLKRGHPKGVDVAHYITPENDLEFLIQFQNTGTDTVHQVIIRDTLSPFLDPATVHPGAASHPYDFDVYGNGIVQFTLLNPNLLPQGSSANEGYVKFRVSQKPEVPCKTTIFNSAAIYFDFNAPVLTNQTYHTVCDQDSFLFVPVIDPHFPNADVKVYPNPFDESTNFEISGVQSPGFRLELYDLMGRNIFNQYYPSPTFRLYRHHLPAGMLFYRLTSEKGRPVASGKLLVR